MARRALIGVLDSMPGAAALESDIESVPEIVRTLRADYAELAEWQRAAAPVGPSAVAALRSNVAHQRAILDYDAFFGSVYQRIEAGARPMGLSGLGCSRGLGLAPLVVWAVAIIAAGAVSLVVQAIAGGSWASAERSRATQWRRAAVDTGNQYSRDFRAYLDARAAHPTISIDAPQRGNLPGFPTPTKPPQGAIESATSLVGMLTIAGAAWLILPRLLRKRGAA